MEWKDEDIKDGYRFKQEISNPDSSINIYRQALLVLREKYLEKMKRARKEDSVFKNVGIIEGIDLAIAEPQRIVNEWEKEVERRGRGEMAMEEVYGA